MIKNLRKNKKGFTLIEIIVVLVIMGILLAIAIPSILGYVGKANDAKYLSQARGGYLAGQTLVADDASKANGASTITINAAAANAELGLKKGGTTEAPTYPEGWIDAIYCTKDNTNTSVKACYVVPHGITDGKYVEFNNGEAKTKSGTVVDGTSVTPTPAS